MLIAYLSYMLRSALIIFGNLLKKGFRPPDYVVFTLHGSYPDLSQPPEGFLQKMVKARMKSLQELENDFGIVGKIPTVKGIILKLSSPTLSLSQVQSLTEMIKELKARGKEVIIWSAFYDTHTYFLATAGDRILLQKGGIIYTLGFAKEQLSMKKALDWCGIELDVVRVSPYKSALDPFIQTDMSEEVKNMIGWLLDSYYEQLVRAIGRGRNLEGEKVHDLIKKTPLFGEEAVEAGAVDHIVNAEELPKLLGSKDKPVLLSSWAECSRRFPRPLPSPPGKCIAVLRIQGNIVEGKSQRPPTRPPIPIPFLFNEQTGDLSFVQQARMAIRDKRVRGVLLYIDSGGGSASASEAITSILKQVAAQKPLVAMLGSMAGSGGYYVATPASFIVAQPGTLTGSIGVISAKIVNSRFLERILFNRETIRRGQNDLFRSPEEPFTEEERKKVWQYIRHVYELFVQHVAHSRNLSPEAVNQVGDGKVWTGEQALEHGLVDKLGGLEAALSKLRKLANLPPNTPLIEIPVPRWETAPLTTTSDWLHYALSCMDQIKKSPVLMAGPLYFHQPWKR